MEGGVKAAIVRCLTLNTAQFKVRELADWPCKLLARNVFTIITYSISIRTIPFIVAISSPPKLHNLCPVAAICGIFCKHQHRHKYSDEIGLNDD